MNAAQPQRDMSTKGKRNSYPIAVALAFFLGIFGAHDFYLGYKMYGRAKLLITVIGIGGSAAMVNFMDLGYGEWTDTLCLLLAGSGIGSIAWSFVTFFQVLFRSGMYSHNYFGDRVGK